MKYNKILVVSSQLREREGCWRDLDRLLDLELDFEFRDRRRRDPDLERDLFDRDDDRRGDLDRRRDLDLDLDRRRDLDRDLRRERERERRPPGWLKSAHSVLRFLANWILNSLPSNFLPKK